MGGLIRGGIEWAGFRMGLEYNFIPDSDLENLNGDKVGTAKNAYLGIHIGFFVGGGKWENNIFLIRIFQNTPFCVVFLCPKIALLCHYELE